MKIDFKTLLPHIVALVLFIIVPVLFFLPALEGKALFQSDIANFLGVVKETADFRTQHHTEPLWTNSMFGGMPTFQVSTEYPANLVQYIFRLLITILPFPAGIVFTCCLGFYVLMNVLKVNPWVGIIGAFGFTFSSFFFSVIAAGHNSEANAIAFMAPTFAGVILTFNGKKLMGGALTALSLALELYSSHLQMTYYLAIIVFAYILTQLIIAFRKKLLPDFLKTIIVLGVAGILGVAPNITSLWLTYDYSKYSTRGKSDLTMNQQNKSGGLAIDYATDWSYSPMETGTLIMPNFVGGASEPIGEQSKSTLDGLDGQQKQAVAQYSQYWGNQRFTSGPFYIGAIVCFFALLGFFVVKGPFKWFVFFTTLVAILLSWGKNFMWFTEIFFYHVPGYNKFRSVYWTLIIADLLLAMLAALSIDYLFKTPNFFKEKLPLRFFSKPVAGMRIFIFALALTGGVTLLCFIAPGSFSNFHKDNEIEVMSQEIKQSNPNVSDQQIQSYLNDLMPAVEQARKKIFTADAIRSTIFILLAAGLVWVYSRKLADQKILLWVLLFFVLMDMYNVDKRYLNDKNFTTKKEVKEPFQPDQADEQILQDKAPDYRVFNLAQGITGDGRTSYFHKSLGGYSGVKMKRYDDILTYNLIEKELEGFQTGNMPIINMLNTRYFIIGGKDGQNHAQFNPFALGNAWFVSNYKLVPSADSEFANLNSFNPKLTAIVNQQYASYLPAHLNYDSTATIKMDNYLPNDLTYTSNAKTDQLAVFAEMYYKDGWNVTVDGKPANYIQANYILRAMMVPAGSHKIEFKFEPHEYYTGEKISLAGSILLILACLGAVYQAMKKPTE